MHSANMAAAALLLIGSMGAQVLSPPEILDPELRALQQKHFPELKAAAVEITSQQYPYKFYLSRMLDVTEQKEQALDQRSIRFAKFHERTVVQVTGNYFAAYSDRLMGRNERVKRTYLEVGLPAIHALAPRLSGEPNITAYALEISYHVRKQVLGVTVENPENLAIIMPRQMAEKAAATSDVMDQITALRTSTVYIDSRPVSLWPEESAEAAPAPEPAPARIDPKPALAPPQTPTPAPVPARDLSQGALQQKQALYQALLDTLVREMDPIAHFVTYAPPSLIAFHKAIYLQLSISTVLPDSAAGSQYRLAALAFDQHVAHLIRPLLAHFKDDPDFDGIVFSSTVKNASTTLSVEFFLPSAELRRYEQYDLTGQQLINSGYVLINGERVGLDLQAAASDLR